MSKPDLIQCYLSLVVGVTGIKYYELCSRDIEVLEIYLASISHGKEINISGPKILLSMQDSQQRNSPTLVLPLSKHNATVAVSETLNGSR